jgi:hypothetical protein
MYSSTLDDFKLSLCFECRMLSSGLFPGVCDVNTNFSEHSVYSLSLLPPGFDSRSPQLRINMNTNKPKTG